LPPLLLGLHERGQAPLPDLFLPFSFMITRVWGGLAPLCLNRHKRVGGFIQLIKDPKAAYQLPKAECVARQALHFKPKVDHLKEGYSWR